MIVAKHCRTEVARDEIETGPDVPCNWTSSDHPQYQAFKSLAAAISCLIARRWNPKADQRISETVGARLAISDNTYETSWAHTGTELRNHTA